MKFHDFDTVADKVDDLMQAHWFQNEISREQLIVELDTTLAMFGWTWDEYDSRLGEFFDNGV